VQKKQPVALTSVTVENIFRGVHTRVHVMYVLYVGMCGYNKTCVLKYYDELLKIMDVKFVFSYLFFLRYN